MSTSSNEHKSCVLCELTGAGNPVIDTINTYIIENMGRVKLREMGMQVCTQVNQIQGKHMTIEDFEDHVRNHTRHQRIVLSVLLDDLLGVASHAKDSCVSVCPESNAQYVDSKMLTAYLKTVDTIMSIYRTDAMKDRKD